VNAEYAASAFDEHGCIPDCLLDTVKAPNLARHGYAQRRRRRLDDARHELEVVHEKCAVVATLRDALWTPEVEVDVVYAGAFSVGVGGHGVDGCLYLFRSFDEHVRVVRAELYEEWPICDCCRERLIAELVTPFRVQPAVYHGCVRGGCSVVAAQHTKSEFALVHHRCDVKLRRAYRTKCFPCARLARRGGDLVPQRETIVDTRLLRGLLFY